MEKSLRKRRSRRRKCLHCHELFFPNPQNRWHQRYCSKADCRHASKIAAQHRWSESEKGRDYFKNSYTVQRVQQWRAAHPGYWKRNATRYQNALQDVSTSQVIENSRDSHDIKSFALQDVVSSQPALLIGLIANLTGSALQDDIAETTRRFINSGQDILGIRS